VNIHTFQNIIKKLSNFGLDINRALDSGISLFGLNVTWARKRLSVRSKFALDRCIELKPKSVLDVGSGGGQHAKAFHANGAAVTCVDFGTSIYAQERLEQSGIRLIETNFLIWECKERFDLVWASHVLEHQRNPGQFIEKLISLCNPGGHVAIIVPTPHRRLWGGHLTLWTPGLLAYNVAMACIDLSDCTIEYGYRETWLLFSPKKIELPRLTYDKNDLELLAPYLPKGFRENTDAWF
jgi:SAM-dependent methyltransferase